VNIPPIIAYFISLLYDDAACNGIQIVANLLCVALQHTVAIAGTALLPISPM